MITRINLNSKELSFLHCAGVSVFTFQSSIVMKKKLKPKHWYCLFTWGIKMQATDHSETVSKFLKSKSRKMSISITKFHTELKHLCQAIFGLRIAIEA